jgi:hypothetical protein
MSEYIASGLSGSFEGCNDCKGLRRILQGAPDFAPSHPCTCNPRWVLFTKRTDDPKLAYLESRLDDLGIAHRRNGESWHAPILEVPEADHERADAILREKIGRRRRTIDDMDDDDPVFRGAR